MTGIWRRAFRWKIGLAALVLSWASGADPYRAPRTADGHPNFNGVWQALGSAHWNLVGHAAEPAPILEMGALGAMPAGLGVVIGNDIPYQPWARARQQANYRDRMTLDPALKCYLPGVPRATYLPFPFQIVQTGSHVFMAYEFADASRVIPLNQPDLQAPIDSWMGHSLGHFEGETLVVKVTDQVADTWLDRSGNFHSAGLTVVERYTHMSPHHLIYEATIEDAAVFERPWRIRLPLYRRMEPDIQLLEFKCVEFVEELMYGHLSKQSDGATP